MTQPLDFSDASKLQTRDSMTAPSLRDVISRELESYEIFSPYLTPAIARALTAAGYVHRDDVVRQATSSRSITLAQQVYDQDPYADDAMENAILAALNYREEK